MLQVGEPAQRTASQHSKYQDFRHLKALAWMINALICSSKINLSEWESYVISRANQAQSLERRWQRFIHNNRVKVRSLYLPVVMAAIANWSGQRLYLALDTTVLWNRFCMIHISVVCCGRAIPFLGKVMEHKSSTVAFQEDKLMLRLSHRLLSQYPDVMLLADRGFANHELMEWLRNSGWRRGASPLGHYCLRLPCDVILHGARKHPIELKRLVLGGSKGFCTKVVIYFLLKLYCLKILNLVFHPRRLRSITMMPFGSVVFER